MSDVPDVLFGHVTIKGVQVFYRSRDPHVSSTIVNENMAMTNYESLYRRGLKHIADSNKEFLEYFAGNSTSGHRATLYSLDSLVEAEGKKEFEGVFKTKDFFKNIRDAYWKYIGDETADNNAYLRKVGYLKDTAVEDTITTRLDQFEATLTTRLNQIESALYREAAIERKLNDPAVQNLAVGRAAYAYAKANKAAIIDEFNKQQAQLRQTAEEDHKRHEQCKKTAEEDHKRHEQCKKTAEDELTQKRADLKRARDDYDLVSAQLSNVQALLAKSSSELKRVRQDLADIQSHANAQASTVVSLQPTAPKKSVLSQYVQQIMAPK